MIYSVMCFDEDWRYQFILANNFCLLAVSHKVVVIDRFHCINVSVIACILIQLSNIFAPNCRRQLQTFARFMCIYQERNRWPWKKNILCQWLTAATQIAANSTWKICGDWFNSLHLRNTITVDLSPLIYHYIKHNANVAFAIQKSE